MLAKQKTKKSITIKKNSFGLPRIKICQFYCQTATYKFEKNVISGQKTFQVSFLTLIKDKYR